MKVLIEKSVLIKETCIPDGDYEGTWGGNQVCFESSDGECTIDIVRVD
mgnify:CR=1 FL=1